MAGYKETEKSGILVIGAGLPRTGTMSLMHALDILLPGECYHGFKAYRNVNLFCKIMKEQCSDEEIKEYFQENYVAAVDLPISAIYDRFMKIFPNAKVVLTIRDPQSWVESNKSTILIQNSFSYFPVLMFCFLFPKYLTPISDDDSLMGWTTPLILACQGFPRMKAAIDAFYGGYGVDYAKSWNDNVEANVPKERFLKFNVKEGWEPLSKFLDLPVPEIPFPSSNNRASLSGYINRNRRRGWLLLYEFISIPLLAYGVYKLNQK